MAVHRGSAGSARHDAPGPARVAARAAFRMMPTEPPGPIAVDRTIPVRSGAERVHRLPSYQAAMVLASGPRPACSSATRPVPAEASRSTSMSARTFGTAGPAACQRPPLSVKMPAKAGRLQPVPSTGAVPGTGALALPNATAVRPVTWQAWPAGVAASARAVDKRVHAAPPCWPSSAPPLVSAMRLPPGPAASASGTWARPGFTGPAVDQLAPLSLVAARGENVRSWLGRNPVSSDAPPAGAATRPPLSATPPGVTSRQAAAPAGRANSSQKFSSWAAEPPISTIAQPVPVPSANDVCSGGGAAGTAGPAGLAAGAAPQPARAPAISRPSGGQDDGQAARAHDGLMTCSAAAESSTANEDFVLAVPGPGSRLSSVLVRPFASMT